jgi:coenzyme F420-0:L-glutamate ligase/coenzyme F420-1:gamma-L-glutamate ligase
MNTKKQLTFITLENIPLIKKGDDLSEIIIACLKHQNISLIDGDIIVIAQKIISKSEGRLIELTTIVPSKKAKALAKITLKDARFIELVLKESKKVIRSGLNTLIVEHKHGFICANAGIDHSNVSENGEKSDNWVLLLPENSDESARIIKEKLQNKLSVRIGILIIDSHGRAWRNGTVGVTIGISGIPGLVDLRGQKDLFGYKLKVTTIGASDELAAGASLLMGQASEGTPCIHVRELIRPVDQDLFR